MKQISIIILLLIRFTLPTEAQEKRIELMTSEGKRIGNTSYTSLKFSESGKYGTASLDGNEVYLDTLGRVFDIPPKGSPKSFYHGVSNGKKFAVFSPKFEQITPYEYDEVKQVHPNVIAVRKDESWGAIDVQGKQLFPFDYEHIEEAKGNFITVENRKTGTSCLMNYLGKALLCEKDMYVGETKILRPELPGLIAVKFSYNWGIVDVDGNVILPFKYSRIDEAYKTDNPLSTVFNGREGAINRDGKLVIDPIYHEIDIFPQGAIAVNYTETMDETIDRTKEKFSFDNMRGEFSFYNAKGELKLRSKKRIYNFPEKKRLQIIYDNCHISYYNYEGELIETIFNSDYDISNPGVFYDCKTDLFGYSDGQNLIIPCIYDYLVEIDKNHLKAVKKDKSGIINMNNKVLLPFKYRYFTKVAPNRCIVTTNNERYEILFDWDGNQLIPRKYGYLRPTPFDSTLFISENDDKDRWGIINIDGKQVVPDIYSRKVKSRYNDSFLDWYMGYGYYHVYKDGQMGILNAKTFREEVPCGSIQSFRIIPNLVGYKSEDKTGAYIATEYGLKQIPAEYEEIKKLQNETIVAKKNGKWGVIDFDNNIKIPFEYDEIKDYYGDIVMVTKY